MITTLSTENITIVPDEITGDSWEIVDEVANGISEWGGVNIIFLQMCIKI
jgi:hypothetical protein